MFRVVFHGGFGNFWNALMSIPEVISIYLLLHRTSCNRPIPLNGWFSISLRYHFRPAKLNAVWTPKTRVCPMKPCERNSTQWILNPNPKGWLSIPSSYSSWTKRMEQISGVQKMSRESITKVFRSNVKLIDVNLT